MKCYKLTDSTGRTHGNTKWGAGVTHETSGTGELCGSGWLHFYSDPTLAVLLNPIHAGFATPRLWIAWAEGDIKHNLGLKSGCTKLTTVREIELPTITTEQRVRFAIMCTRVVCWDENWNRWAYRWLIGQDRSEEAAEVAGTEADGYVVGAPVVTKWVRKAVAATKEVARMAAEVTEEAEEKKSRGTADWAAAAAAAAAEAAAEAAAWMEWPDCFDLIALAQQAVSK